MSEQQLFSNVKITPVETNTNFLGHGSMVVSGVVEVKFTLMKGSKGVFASLPSRRSKEVDPATGKYSWFPEVKVVGDDNYKMFQEIVRAEYNKVKGDSLGEENQAPADDLPF